MWRTIVIHNGERLSVKDNLLLVYRGEDEIKVPIVDIYSIVIDNSETLFSVASLTILADAGIHIVFCDKKHLPSAVVLPFNNHYRPLAVLNSQIEMGENLKAELWQKVITAKIINQAFVLKYCGVDAKVYKHVLKFSEEVEPTDVTNREGLSAKMFFRALYGTAFIRHSDDAINAALNYGYSIIRSAIGRTLVAYGYNCCLGIHHVNKSNAFNLADEMMEPLRPIVDRWIDDNIDDLLFELTTTNKKFLVNIVNQSVSFDGKTTKLRYAIDRYIQSLTTAIEKNNPSLLKIPIIIKDIGQESDDGDD